MGTTNLTALRSIALRYLEEGRIDEPFALVAFGPARNRTLHALERKGLARYYPTSETWGITDAGRAALAGR